MKKIGYIAIGSIIVLVAIIVYALATETQEGCSLKLSELQYSMRKLKAREECSAESPLLKFPYKYPVEWVRMQIRPQFHWKGKYQASKLEAFFCGTGIKPIKSYDDEAKKVKLGFVLDDGEVWIEGKIDLENEEFSFAAVPIRK